MKLHLYLALAVITVAGCSAAKPISEDYDADIAPGGHPPAGFFVNPKFPGGESVMTAARRVLPDCGYLALSRFRIGADSQYDFVVFFVGRDIKNSFEAIYYRDLVFVKKKSDRDWSNARVFDCQDLPPIGAFNGPLEVLESKGEELGKKPTEPNQALQHNDPSCHASCLRTPRASRGRG